MQSGNVYALLIGVGDYEKLNTENLPTYRMDLAMIGTAFEKKLRVPFEHMRILAGEENNGYVRAKDLAFSIAEFKGKLKADDTFIFYFSGHGSDRNILFSDGQVELQSIIDYIRGLQARTKLVIFDCCYSGDFSGYGAGQMKFQESMSEFAGKGIAVLASSSANEVSRLGPNGEHSMFSGALSSAIHFVKADREGKITLDAIYLEMMRLVNAWNQAYPDRAQWPVFRSSIGGTVFFRVAADRTYRPREIRMEGDGYRIVKVAPMSTGGMKRLAASVITDRVRSGEELSPVTREIAEKIRLVEVYSDEKDELVHGESPARAIWCYFGQDDGDILNGCHYAYTIWAGDAEARSMYFRGDGDFKVVDDICVWTNASYGLLRMLREPSMSREDFIREHRSLLSVIVSLAEQFTYDLQEAANRTLEMRELPEKYGDWIRRVKEGYLKIADEDIPPDDIHEWAMEIQSLAGWVADMAVILEEAAESGMMDERKEYLIRNAVDHYHESMLRLSGIEQTVKPE